MLSEINEANNLYNFPMIICIGSLNMYRLECYINITDESANVRVYNMILLKNKSILNDSLMKWSKYLGDETL